MSDRLTAIQTKILEYLKLRSREGGGSPSVREIGAAVGLKSTSSVQNNLIALDVAGYITRDAGLNRSIRLTDEPPVVQVPLLGKVTAGMPVLAFEELVASIPFPADHGQGGDLFALRVMGDSMVNAGILDGDIVIAEKVASVHNGEIVVALIDDEATVKRIYREVDHVRLQPENDLYEPIYSRDVSVLGRVIACIRYYG
ncbi:MAG: transcriptional repressor LexA [Oscillospiraceae bacterium]|nr:transcriptional repressor LexA [Oscillospiraceae bacterium]